MSSVSVPCYVAQRLGAESDGAPRALFVVLVDVGTALWDAVSRSRPLDDLISAKQSTVINSAYASDSLAEKAMLCADEKPLLVRWRKDHGLEASRDHQQQLVNDSPKHPLAFPSEKRLSLPSAGVYPVLAWPGSTDMATSLP